MSTFPHAIYAFLRKVVNREEGQDLVEYALIMAMISLGSVAGMGAVAASVNGVFSAVTTTLTTNV